MKKTLVILLAFVFVLGITVTAFAAPANPFVDVPAKHWAYGAVSKLAKAGIVDGYGDGTFRGDRTMTRYEMAQIVAKAMAKSDKADAEMKALIDKLAVEFAAELNNLGVRVAKLEAKTNVSWTFESRLRWSNDDSKANVGTNQFDLRQRIYLSGVVNDKIDYGARIQSDNIAFGSNATTQNLYLNRMFFNIKDFAGIDKITVGRFPTLTYTMGLLSGSTNGVDGAAITTKMGDQVTFKGYVASPQSGFDYDAATTKFDQNTAYYGSFEFATSKDVSFNVGYQAANFKGIRNWPNKDTYLAGQRIKVNSIDLGAAAKMGDFWLKGEYVNGKDKVANVTTKAFQFAIANSTTKYFGPVANLVDVMKAHTDGFEIGYKSIEPNATPVLSSWNGWLGSFGSSVTGTATQGMTFDNNCKGWYLEYQNVLSKGLVFSFFYTDLKAKTVPAGALAAKDKAWQGTLEFYF